jgi:hypothetical protein
MVKETTQEGAAPDETPPWGLRDIGAAVILTLIVMAVPVFVLIAAGVVIQMAGGTIPISQVVITVALVLLQNLAFAIGMWIFGLRKHRVGIDRLGLRPFEARAGCIYAAFSWLLALGFNVFYNGVLVGVLERKIEVTPILPLFGGGLLGFALALVLASLVVPFVEEAFFRGFLFPGLTRRFGFAVGALVSSLLFGAAHLNGDTFIPLSFFGLVLSLMYSATGSIYPGIMMHSVNNSFALLAAFLAESGLLNTP